MKYLNGNLENFEKKLDLFLSKRKLYQNLKSQNTKIIINDIKKNGDKSLLKYEKKFSKIKTKNNKIKFSKKEINSISKKINPKLKDLLILYLKELKNFI